MINVATIGSSWITEQFIRACQLTNLYKLQAVYSRSITTGKDFAQVFKAEYYTDSLNHILYDPDVHLVYIASPNSLHFQQAREAVRAGKHVIIEKPMLETSDQWHEIHQLAQRTGAMIFEGVLHVQNRNYRRFKEIFQRKMEEKSQPFLGANFNIGQYSSRYIHYLDAVHQDRPVPNVFNLDMSGGALMDLGVYPIYVAIELFGTPKDVHYYPQLGPNGVDLSGHILLQYEDYGVQIFVSKAVYSELKSELYIDDETLVIHDISRFNRVDLLSASGQAATPISYTPENPMYDELIHFSEVIKNRKDQHYQLVYESWKQMSLQVVQTMERLRKSAGLKIAADR